MKRGSGRRSSAGARTSAGRGRTPCAFGPEAAGRPSRPFGGGTPGPTSHELRELRQRGLGPRADLQPRPRCPVRPAGAPAETCTTCRFVQLLHLLRGSPPGSRDVPMVREAVMRGWPWTLRGWCYRLAAWCWECPFCEGMGGGGLRDRWLRCPCCRGSGYWWDIWRSRWKGTRWYKPPVGLE